MLNRTLHLAVHGTATMRDRVAGDVVGQCVIVISVATGDGSQVP